MAFNDLYSFDLGKGIKSLELYSSMERHSNSRSPYKQQHQKKEEPPLQTKEELPQQKKEEKTNAKN